MKRLTLLLFIVILFSKSLSAQYVPSDHSSFIGISSGTNSENYIRLEHEIRDKYILLQTSVFWSPEDYGIQYKTGVGYVGEKFRIYGYIPYLNFSLKEMSYNTPFGIEAFFEEGMFQSSIHLDIYTSGIIIVPSVRIRYRLTKFRF